MQTIPDTHTIFAITRALLVGDIGYGDAGDVADALASGDPWSTYDASVLARSYGVRNPGTLDDGRGWGPNW